MNVDVMKVALMDMLNKFMVTVPSLLSALVILILGLIIAKIVSKIVYKVLKKSGIDKLGDKLKQIDIVEKSNVVIKISKLLSEIIYYFIVLFFTVAATSVLGIPEISNLVSDIFSFIPNLIVALIILILGTLFADMVKRVVSTALSSLGVGSANLIASFLFYFLFINIAIVALGQAKIDTDFLSQNLSIIIGGVVAAFAIGYGLASKDIMANMLSSFYSKDQFKIGQKVTIDDSTGIVLGVDKSSLTIKTETGKVTFPLRIATNTKVIYHD